MLTIGNLKLSSPFILSPLAGVSDLPFRLLNRAFGCELAFTEMIDVRSLCYGSKRTEEMLTTSKHDRPLGIQIVGNEPKYILQALEALRNRSFDILDFNAACPAKKITSKGKGASLLREPQKLQELLTIIVKHSPVPVTVKIRTGWAHCLNAKEIALRAQEAGVSGLFIHGRTKTQGYMGNVDYTTIAQVKKILDIPVIASGDIFSKALVEKMFSETGCDAVAVARGALGNPWIFKEMLAYHTHKNFHKPGIDDIATTMCAHLKSCADFYPHNKGIVIFRKFFNWYTKGFRNARMFREKICRTKTTKEMLTLIEEFRTIHCAEQI